MAVDGVPNEQLIRWAEALAAIARTGLGFTQSLYERERFEEVLHVAADMRSAADHPLPAAELRSEWMKIVGSGVPGYVTPKVAVGAVVGNGNGELLLMQRADSGFWLYPTGWADVGYSPAEVAVKEVKEETGIDCEVVGILGVTDGMRMGFTQIPLYSIVFHCQATGGELQAHPLEARNVGWFGPDSLPDPIIGVHRWGDAAFAAVRGEPQLPFFDAPRTPVWRDHPDHRV
jgi:ADP-ribose pyrophosphatase YjhB (NUDIX family)